MKLLKILYKYMFPLIIILLLIGFIIYGSVTESFQTTCPAGKSLKCPTGFPRKYNNKCYKNCSSGYTFKDGVCVNKNREVNNPDKKDTAGIFTPQSTSLACL